MFREVSRDKRQILSKEKCEEILKSTDVGVLSVSGDDDYPYGVPINFAYEDGKVYFHGMPSGHKYDAMMRHDKVSLTVVGEAVVIADEYTSYFRSVVLFGKARFVEDYDEKLKIVDLLVDKYCADYKEGVHEQFADRIAWMGAFEIDVEHMSGKECIEWAAPDDDPFGASPAE